MRRRLIRAGTVVVATVNRSAMFVKVAGGSFSGGSESLSFCRSVGSDSLSSCLGLLEESTFICVYLTTLLFPLKESTRCCHFLNPRHYCFCDFHSFCYFFCFYQAAILPVYFNYLYLCTVCSKTRSRYSASDLTWI